MIFFMDDGIFSANNFVKAGERIEEIGFGGLRLIQNPKWFCFGIDAVLLADFAKTANGERIADLGTGTGVIPLILSEKACVKEIIGIEIQKDVAEMAQRSIRLNSMDHVIKILNIDVKETPDFLQKSSCDAVVSNPPYIERESGIKNKDAVKASARHEISAVLEDFISAAYYLLKNKGSFFLVHRPHRLVDILLLCRAYKLEPKKIRFVHPKKNKKPNIVLLQCVKHGNPELKFLDPLYVYEETGIYTDEILKIYGKK